MIAGIDMQPLSDIIGAIYHVKNMTDVFFSSFEIVYIEYQVQIWACIVFLLFHRQESCAAEHS